MRKSVINVLSRIVAKIITKNETILPNVTEPHTTQRTCVLVDGHAYIQTLGKPKAAKHLKSMHGCFSSPS